MRRTERWTQVASLKSRSRSVLTWASAQAVPWAWACSVWKRMYAVAVRSTRNWLAVNRWQLVRSIASP